MADRIGSISEIGSVPQLNQDQIDQLADVKDRIVDRIHASEEELAAAEEVEKHWVHWVK